jgi:translation initiation factor IF-2
MPDLVKEKKLRLYKYASEFNLSTESLLEFLQKKGYDVKGHMSLLNDDMITDIKTYFKKDIEKAEKHYKKITEFQKKRSEHSESEAAEAQKAAAAEAKAEEKQKKSRQKYL